VADLYSRHARRIFNLALRFAAEPTEAEDLTQEVFLRVCKKIHTLRPGTDPDPWLTRVAVNVFLNRRPSHPAPGPLEGDPPAKARPAKRLEALEEARRLLGRLSPIRRMVFLLVHHESHTATEAAALCNMPVNTVKSHLKRARRTLAEALKRRPEHELP